MLRLQRALRTLFRGTCPFSTTYAGKHASSLPDNWGQKQLKYQRLEKFQAVLQPARLAVKSQVALVQELEKNGVAENKLKEAQDELARRKQLLEDLVHKALVISAADKKQFRMEGLLARRFYYSKSNSIYQGSFGLCDLGPLGIGIKNNILNMWRKFFVAEEQMLELSSSVIVPENVLRASGHIEKFSDFLVRDVKTGEGFRLDHFIEDKLKEIVENPAVDDKVRRRSKELLMRLSELGKDDMMKVIDELGLKTINGNDVSAPEDFNLMFELQIGPVNKHKGYLRPELAQGIFTNFKQLLNFNEGRLPFAAAQIGPAFRNEINPKSGLFRLREFTLAEVEVFVDPKNKTSNRFHEVKDVALAFVTADSQSLERMSISNAVGKNVLPNQMLAYYLGRAYLFLTNLGIDGSKIRVRQHEESELAHYASGCWDIECETYDGWIECVGCADRSCFDLTSHGASSGVSLTAKRNLPKPVTQEITKLKLDKKLAKQCFGADAKLVSEALTELGNKEKEGIIDKLLENGTFTLKTSSGQWELTKDVVSAEKVKEIVDVEEFVPHVIEFSFGIERILQVLFDHTFVERDDDKRTYFSLKPSVASVKCSIFPVIGTETFVEQAAPYINEIARTLKDLNMDYKIDTENKSIGKKYTYNDESSVPFAITIDQDTLKKPNTTTLRFRDSMEQVRIPIQELSHVVADLVLEKTDWSDIKKKYSGQEKDKSEKKSVAL